MPHRLSITIVPAVLLATLLGCGPGREPVSHLPDAAGEVLAEGRHDFRDDHGPDRIVGEVGVRLERTRAGDSREPGAVRLVVEPSATGATIHPIPGLRGVRGSNHRTALELERIAREGAIEIVTRPLEDPDAPGARSRAIGRRHIERLAERRTNADGTIDHAARSAPRLVGFELTTGPLGRGEWTSTVVVRGRPRLTVDFRFDGEHGQILGIRSVDRASSWKDAQ